MENQKSVTDFIEEVFEEVREEICDNYCKYSDRGINDKDIEKNYCENCPLNKL